MAVSSLYFPYHPDKFMDLVRPKHKIYMRSTPDQHLSLLLGHTACDAKDQGRFLPLELLDLTDFSVNLVLCRFPHTASIDQNEICCLHILCPLITNGLELSFHAFRIGKIHLTAVYNKFYKLFFN